ncbi:MAG TPA: hypothetical protein VGN86_09610 [Pyrinomonadaceae bacterium]|nr:hypothetical protein [Pyrinomonadaceae bacterium]
MSKKILSLVVMLLLGILCAHAQDNPQSPAPSKYRLELVYISDVASQEYLFVIGTVGFKSVDSLKTFLSNLPPDSILEWAPGCHRWGGEPLLSSERDMEDFKAFCVANKIDFILIPSG